MSTASRKIWRQSPLWIGLGSQLILAFLDASAFAASSPLSGFGFSAQEWSAELGAGAAEGVTLIPGAINVKVTPQRLGARMYVYVGVRNQDRKSAWARVDLPLGSPEGTFDGQVTFPGMSPEVVPVTLRFQGKTVRSVVEKSCDATSVGIARPQGSPNSSGDYIFMRCRPQASGALNVEVASLSAGGAVSGVRWTDGEGTQDFGAIDASEQSSDGFLRIKVPAPGVDQGRREIEFNLGDGVYRIRKQKQGIAAAGTQSTPARSSSKSLTHPTKGSALSFARFGIGGYAGIYVAADASGTLNSYLSPTVEISYLPRYRHSFSPGFSWDVGAELGVSLINHVAHGFIPGLQAGLNTGPVLLSGSLPLLLEFGLTNWSKDEQAPQLTYAGFQFGYENPKGLFGLSILRGVRAAVEKNLGSADNQRTWQGRIGAVLSW